MDTVTIAILESNKKRVTWLKGALPPEIQVLATNDVELFIERQNDNLSLIIIGCDVGDETVTADSDLIQRLTPECPVLLWNTDPDVTDALAKVLLDRGTPCVITPYSPHNLAAIKQLILSSIY